MEQAIGNEHRLTELESLAHSNKRRIESVEKRQDDLEKLTSSITTLAANQKHMESDVKEIKADVKSLNAKPGKRWDAIVDKVIWAVLAAVIAFLLGRVGL
jgi:predicted  nucleic acid-binding Zn-ribbon protein